MLRFRPLTLVDIEVKVDCLSEDIDPDGQFDDPTAVQWVKDQLEAGNEWAWFCAKVTVTYSLPVNGCWQDFSESDYLGACSYESEEDFKECDYYHNMKKTALDKLNKRLSDVMDLLILRVEIVPDE